jgi:tetratricopeptide (TPR) repeat protein
MKAILIICLLVSFSLAGCNNAEQCVDGINKLPMFGGVKKCRAQIEADEIFLSAYKTPQSKKAGLTHTLMRAWQYFYAKQLDTSMIRFNQAWLLDSLNADVYWGFGNILGTQKRFKESLPFFKKSLKIDSGNSKAWQDMSISYGNIFFENKEKVYLDSSIYATKKAIKLDQKNPQFYSQLTSDYSYFVQHDSAKKYLKITESLDPKAVNPEVKKLLDGK